MKEERWKKEFEHYKKNLESLKKALTYAGQKQEDEELTCLILRGEMQTFGVVVHSAGRVMNEYMQSLGQNRNKSLKNTLSKALKMGVITYQKWLEAESDLDAFYDVADVAGALKVEKKIRRTYLPLLERFNTDMALKCQPTLFG